MTTVISSIPTTCSQLPLSPLTTLHRTDRICKASSKLFHMFSPKSSGGDLTLHPLQFCECPTMATFDRDHDGGRVVNLKVTCWTK